MHFIATFISSVAKYPDSHAFGLFKSCSASSHYSHIGYFCSPNSHRVLKTAKNRTDFSRQDYVKMFGYGLKYFLTSSLLCNKRFGSLSIILVICSSCLSRLNWSGDGYQLKRWVVCGFVGNSFNSLSYTAS
jgi:hypothetical protein